MRARNQHLDTLLVPCAGGGLLAGCAAVCAALSPSTAVIGIESAGNENMARALFDRAVTGSSAAGTLCDALIGARPTQFTIGSCVGRVLSMFSVDDPADV